MQERRQKLNAFITSGLQSIECISEGLTIVGQKVYLLVRCSDFRGCNVHKQGTKCVRFIEVISFQNKRVHSSEEISPCSARV